MAEDPKQITLPAALADVLGKLEVSVVTRYDLACEIWRIYKQKSSDGIPLRRHRDELDRPSFLRVEAQLVRNGVLRPLQGLPDTAAYVLIGAHISDPRVFACAIDPFCYVSHLSAMEFHGLTDRLPEHLYISTPSPTQWRIYADKKMEKDLGDDLARYQEIGLPPLQRHTLTKLAGRPVTQFKSLHLGAFRNFRDQNIRVSTLGRTFLDMLREPTLCGGITHVLSVFHEAAPSNIRAILDEVDQHGKIIDKMRAGYILENICKIVDPRIDNWAALAQRGGSRKLDATNEYSPNFSERWAISINTIIPTEWIT